ncbi:hypothetical protein CKO28_00570 [Rhodovibrio sodomensis]|uniref:Uncharacterized protein n=1 Tax=Rhodovibrio sodomensis TaxID=1088 RepID=A0ABS1D7Y2_9PROT|nr:hypothetical protein [Rhodovibrio sodomensis]MBK1666534.1 hypothetical protein [Rhodovibrio sodomensis]
MDYQLLRNDQGAWCLVIDRISDQPPGAAALTLDGRGFALRRDGTAYPMPPMGEQTLANLVRDLGPADSTILVVEMLDQGVQHTYEADLRLAGARR